MRQPGIESSFRTDELLMTSGCRDFYITDANAGFLICYSDHDIILAAGTAQPWLAKLPPAR